jgi:hypothetical protein
MVDRDVMLGKLVRMFTPYPGSSFLNFRAADVIRGPNDRSMFGFDTNFPKEWLVEDFGFSTEEADWLVARVKEIPMAVDLEKVKAFLAEARVAHGEKGVEIKEWFRRENENYFVALTCLEALVAEVEGLRAECKRLRGL